MATGVHIVIVIDSLTSSSVLPRGISYRCHSFVQPNPASSVLRASRTPNMWESGQCGMHRATTARLHFRVNQNRRRTRIESPVNRVPNPISARKHSYSRMTWQLVKYVQSLWLIGIIYDSFNLVLLTPVYGNLFPITIRRHFSRPTPTSTFNQSVSVLQNSCFFAGSISLTTLTNNRRSKIE